MTVRVNVALVLGTASGEFELERARLEDGLDVLTSGSGRHGEGG